MKRTEKEVFISYRRENSYHARAVYQDLVAHGFDVFLDVEDIKAGKYRNVILENIQYRTHFVVLLTPTALDRCINDGDWLRLEIETALEHKRNIIPLFFDDFDYHRTQSQLVGKLAELAEYQAVTVYAQYFDAAMHRLRTYLGARLDELDVPVMKPDAPLEKQVVDQAWMVPITQDQLTAAEYFERAVRQAQDNYDKQIQYLTRAIELAPDYADAFNLRGMVHSKIGKDAEALDDYTRALELNPQLSAAYHNRALLYAARKQYEQSMQDYNAALDFSPEDAELYVNRGRLFFDQGNPEAALQDYTRATQFDPRHKKAYLNRATLYRDLGQLEEALEDCDTAIELDESYPKAFILRGSLYTQQQKYQQALEDYNRAVFFPSTRMDALLYRGLTHYQLGELESAIADYNQVLMKKPDSVRALFSRGVAYQQRGDCESAISDYERVLEIDPQNKNAQHNLAVVRSNCT